MWYTTFPQRNIRPRARRAAGGRVRCATVALAVCLTVAWSGHAAGSAQDSIRQLGRLVTQALEANPAVQAAQAQVEAALAQRSAADQPLYNPELEVDAERAEANSAYLGLQQAIDWADKRGARTQVAEGELEASRHALADRRRQVAGELLSALAELQTATALKALAARRTALMKRFVALAEKRRRAGDLSLSELELARLAYTQARLNEADAAASEIEARQALVAVAGTDRVGWPALPEALPEVSITDLDAVLTRLPAIRAQQARVRTAMAEVERRTRERRPDPSLGLRGGRDGDAALIGLNLSIPLFVRNTFKAEVEVANAERIAAERELQERMRRGRAELASALERYRLARGAWRLWTESGVPSLDKQVRLLDRVWRAGELGTTEYLVQVDQTLATRADALAARGRLWRSWFDWLRASDGFADWFGWEK